MTEETVEYRRKQSEMKQKLGAGKEKCMAHGCLKM